MFAQDKKTTIAFSASRHCVLLATGALSVLVFLLDALLAQETVRRCNVEFVLYGLGLSLSVLYTCFASKKRRQPKQQSKVESDDAPGSGEALLKKLWSWIRSTRDVVQSCAKQLIQDLRSPTVERRAPQQDKPVVPGWAVCACLMLAVSVSVALVVAVWSGRTISQEEATFFDAARKECGPDGKPLKTGGVLRGSIGWLTIAFGLASGLCTVHPLQSGMAIGF